MKTVSSITAAALLLGACSTTSPTETAATPGPPRRPTPTRSIPAATSRLGVDEALLQGQTVHVWHPWFGVEADFFASLVEEFNTSNEWGIEVIASGQPGYSSLYEGVTTALPTTDRPDAAVALPEHALAWDAEGLVADLAPYTEDPRYGTDVTDFQIIFWNQDVHGGRRVALPAQRSARFLLWNESMAGELGFAAPPETTSAFERQVCGANQAMRKDESPQNDAYGGWVISSDVWTAYGWMLAFQGAVIEGEDYRFLSPNNIAAFKYLKDLQLNNCAWMGTPPGSPTQGFATRQALVATAGLEDLPALSREMAEAGNADQIRALPFPGDAVIPVYGSSYVLFRSSPERQLAGWLFIRWLTEPEQDARWVETTHLFPLRQSTRALLASYERSHPQWAEVVELLPEGYLQPQLASWRSVKVMFEDGVTCLFSGQPMCDQPPVVLAQMESTSREISK